MTQKLITKCFHCGEAVTDGDRWSTVIDGKPQAMCCPGCKAVAEAIIDSGLNDYYQHRTKLPDVSPAEFDSSTLEARETLLFYDSPALQQQFVARVNNMAEASFIIDGISCAACSWLIEHRMAQLKGVTKATLNLSNHRLFIQWNHDEVLVSSLIEALLRLGYKARSEEHTSELQSRPH